MAKKISENAIPDINADWGKDASNGLPYSGQAVQTFIKDTMKSLDSSIKKKVGWWCWSTNIDASNFYHLWGFASEDDCTKYKSDPEANASLLLVNEALPISTVQGDSYSAYLFADVSKTADLVVSGNELTAKVRFCAVKVSNGERLNNGSMGTLIIERSTDGAIWKVVDTRNGALVSTDYGDENNYTEVKLGNALITGKQKLRLRAQYTYTADDGSEKTVTSTYVLLGNSITKTTLNLTCQQNWQTPILASAYSSRGFPISYMVYGAVEKTLHVEITGGNNQVLPAEYALTADQDSATITKNIVDSTDAYKLFKHGVRTVKAWLTCDNGMGGTISSNVLVNRFMVVNPTTDADKTTPYLLLQNVIDKADNYAQADICQYAVFSPGSNGTTNDGKAVSVIFYLTAYAENFPDDNPTQYFRIEQNVQPAVQNTLNTTIEIESESDSKTTIPAYFRIWRKDGDHEVNFMKDSINQSNLVIQVDNSESYAPKTGADFVLNPKTRNNSENNPLTIINAKTGKEIESTWEGFGLVRDGWLQSDVDGQRVLRVPAGAKLNFKYNPFAQFLTTADSALEIELDFMMRNVTNETDPIISLFENLVTSDASGNQTTTFRGLKMCPMHGEIHTKSNAVSSETDFNWREGVRTHIAINIHNAVAPNKGDGLVPSSTTLDTTATKIALVRVFINGDIEREFKYSITDTKEFCTADMSNGGFTIGQDGADIDIYSIRVYQNNALESSDVLNNYISTLPTTAEKKEVRKRNAILTGGKVDLQKCRELGMRCLVWHGVEPYKENTSKQKGYWEIFQYGKEGNYLPEYSGTLCKETASLEATRQGSTANTYFYSNLQTKMQSVKETITVPLAQLHSSITYEVHDVTQADGTTKKMVSLCGGNLGKGFPVNEKAVDYEYTTKDGTDAVIVPDGWVDGNGKYRGVGYIVAKGTPMGQKLVNKINYASSMQSHLTGANNLYNDLHRIIVGKNAMQEACETARVSKYTEPFLFFTQALDSDTPVYRGPCTFGAGKMDKVAAGYDKKTYPNFTLLEGSDNNYELTDMRVPFTWNCPDCSENITYSAEDEGFFYNGKQCIDFDAGTTDENEVPKESLIKLLSEAWNFLYLHSPMVSYYKGTFDAFQASDEAKNVFNKVWCTDGDDAYKLKRYDFADKKWVDAGLWDDTTKRWKVIDIRTDEITKDTYEASSNQSEYAALNIEIRGAIVAHAKKYLGWYFKTDSLKLYYTFIIHLLAGTDSCSKNTYFAIDPKKVSVTIDGVTKDCYLFEMWTDDVDTLLPIDNNGRSTKAYYIDRMHPYIDGDSTTEKYEGMHNILFNLCEEMWEGTKELQDMLKRIFTAMEGLVSEKDYIEGIPSNVPKVSVYGCLWKYIYYVHKYFPQTAYNEAARIRYEYPEMLGFVSYGSGARGVRPITQSNGSLLECELQFIERRLILMASYAAWGPFADGKSGNLGIVDATESFSMQAFHLPDSATSTNDYSFEVKPHQYIYPTGMLGQTVVDPHVRVAPGQKFKLDLGSTTSNDTGMSVSGINYYRSIGNLGDLSTTPANTITVNGKRLTEFVAEPTKTYTDSETGAATPAFRPGAIVVAAKNLKTLSLKGCTATTGSIDLSDLARLESVDVRQTKLIDVSLPETSSLTSVQLPATIQEVNITNQSSISTLTLEGYSNLQKFILRDNNLLDSYTYAVGIYAAKPSGLKSVEFDHVQWNTDSKRCSMDMLMYFADIKAALIGVIYMMAASSDRALTLTDKLKLCSLYGNIDDKSNSLYIQYEIRAITKLYISGQSYLNEAGKDYAYSIATRPSTGNNIAVKDGKLQLKWSLAASASQYATLKDDKTGIVHVNALSDARLELKHELSLEATTIDNEILTASKMVWFYTHIPKVGDFAYADGTFDADWDDTRECVGIVFMRQPVYDADGKTVTAYDVHICGREDLFLESTSKQLSNSTHRWGLYPDNNNGFDSSESAIKAATGLSSVFDIPTIPNIGSRWNGTHAVDGGTSNNINYDHINADNYLDANQEDGYKVIKSGAALSDYDGKGKTEKIVEHSQLIITQYLDRPLPKTLKELADAMQSLKDENASATNNWRYEEFYYPAAYGCHLYEPSVKETLAEQYKSGKWYCPACGELGRLYNFKRLGLAVNNANDNPASEAVTPIFANANKKAGGTIFSFVNNWYWSVSEISANSSWYVYFNDGAVYTNGYKCFSYYVRPCTAFTFHL